MCSAWLFIIAALVKSDVIFLYIHCSWKLVDSFPFLDSLYLIHYSTVNQLSSVNEDDTLIDVPVDENCQLTDDRHPDPDERMSTMESWNPIPDTASKSSWLNNAAKRCQFEKISWNTGILFVMRRELEMYWRTHFSVSLVRKSIEKPNKTTEQKINWHNKTLDETLCRLIENVSICVIA